jgi:hypothetical protein
VNLLECQVFVRSAGISNDPNGKKAVKRRNEENLLARSILLFDDNEKSREEKALRGEIRLVCAGLFF